MPELQLYEYAVIRIVPRVEREEFINAGIILFCKKTEIIECLILLNEEKIGCLDAEINIDQVKNNLSAFERIAAGDTQSPSGIARLDAPSRFRWLTATRSTIVQCSKVHPGMTTDITATAKILLDKLVL